MSSIGTLCALLMCVAPVAAQGTGPAAPQIAAVRTEQSATAATPQRGAVATAPGAAVGTAPTALVDAKPPSSDSGMVDAGLLVIPLAEASGQQTAAQRFPVPSKPAQPFRSRQGFQWNDALKQYMTFLTFQHSVRLLQKKTYSEFGGPFWSDYVESVGGLRGWDDGDSLATNYLGHPMMGAVSGYIQVQNDPAGRPAEFGRNHAYWRSRGWAFVAAAIYSTQFELGPMSEASIGNVGMKPGTMAWVDLVVTPVFGLGMIVAEDAVDRYLIARVEGRLGPNQARLLRSLLNPNRSLANLIRFQVPWKRDARDFISKASLEIQATPAATRDRAAAPR